MPDQQTPPREPLRPGAGPEGTSAHLARLETRPSFTERNRRIGERIVEGLIFGIAGMSIIFIFLIFYFTFREAAPIFFGSGKTVETAAVMDDYRLPGEKPEADTSSAAASGDTSEVYNPDSGAPPALPGDSAAAPAVKKKDAATGSPKGDTSSGSEVYNPESGAPPALPADSTPAPASAATAEQTAKTNDSNSRLIVGNDYPILDRETPIKLSYLYYHNWQPNSDHPRYGIFPILVGTLKTTLIALLIAAPLSILAALYTAFFAPKRLRETLKPIIEILAGFPSVVVGFFCLMTVASLVQTLFGIDYRLNAFVGGIGLALAVIPIIYTISDDALRAVPGSLREAALAIGASEWQAAYQVMLPAATPGIFAALLLGLGRAFGETMIALMATGNAGTFSWNFFEPVRTFAATIGAEMGEVQHGSPHYQILFLLGVILFIFSFAINLVTEFYVKQRLIKKFRGAE
ncbi:MAG: Phosphate transport system permease protein [Chlorobi bacterium]|nr:Phosphate transport system permease protein [Chlorobiota bacterium]